MNRRDFLRAATGGAGVAGATGAAQASDSSAVASVAANNTTTAGNETGNQTSNQTTTSDGGDLPGSGKTVTVPLVADPYKFEGATDSPLYVQPGATVRFVWESDNHNIVVESQPEGASWSGVETIYNSGHTYEHTFTTTGTYEFYCEPHRQLGMTGTIVVNESGEPPGGGGGPATLSPHEMGVPFQAQYVGVATLLAMFVALVFTFFTLKYGSSPHTSAPNKRD